MTRMLILIALLTATGAAQAQTAPPRLDLRPRTLATPAPDLAPLRAAVFAQANALRSIGVARTSVDRHVAGDGVTGSLGFLCGLQPHLNDSGAAQTYGVDPHGRFVGAKLSYAF